MHKLIEDYARLVTSDVDACAELFATDADYITVVGSYPLHLKGREAIRNFIAKAPRTFTVRVTAYREQGETYMAALRMEAPRASATDTVRFKVADDKFTHFEVIHNEGTI